MEKMIEEIVIEDRIKYDAESSKLSKQGITNFTKLYFLKK
jgi:hypothetical protein